MSEESSAEIVVIDPREIFPLAEARERQPLRAIIAFFEYGAGLFRSTEEELIIQELLLREAQLPILPPPRHEFVPVPQQAPLFEIPHYAPRRKKPATKKADLRKRQRIARKITRMHRK